MESEEASGPERQEMRGAKMKKITMLSAVGGTRIGYLKIYEN